MLKVAVLDDYDGSVASLDCWSKLKEEAAVHFFSSAQKARDLSDFEVIVAIRERTLITREFLEETSKLRHLALTGRLSGQADLETLKERKIAVSFTEGSGDSPVELTIALILGATKRLHKRHENVRSGGWQNGLSTDLKGKTLGVLGLGRIGTRVALFGKFMGMEVVSWGPTPDQGRSEKLGVRRVELDECLSASDVVAISLRLSDKTKALLGARELALLKEGALLVNTSRAEIIERGALYAELESRRINAALDVFHTEPLSANDPIRQLDNVLLSPHMGYVSREVYQKFFGQVVDNILAWKQGRPFKDALS